MQEVRLMNTDCQNNGTLSNISNSKLAIGETSKSKVGFITTWNQPCGLASYAKQLLADLKDEDIIILAENTRDASLKDDTENVVRCWHRDIQDYSDLYNVILEKNIDILYLYCHYDFFANINFIDTICKLKQIKDLKVILHLHNTFTNQFYIVSLISISNKIVVHTQENRLQVIANGAIPQNVIIAPLGTDSIPRISDEERKKTRAELGLKDDEKLLLSFGFIQPHKRMDIIINAVKDALIAGFRVKGAIVGSTRDDDINSKRYLQDIKDTIKNLCLQDYIQIYDNFISDEKLNAIIQCSEIVYLNYQANYYESSGAGNLALMNGALLVTSIAPSFGEYKDAVWHLTGGFPVGLSTKILLSNPQLKEEILKNAQKYIETHSFHNASKIIRNIFNELSCKNLLEKQYV